MAMLVAILSFSFSRGQTDIAFSPRILVDMLLSVQLLMAYPGIIAGNTIVFNALGLSTDYIGLFSAYSVFIKNASPAYSITYRLLEVTESSYSAEAIDIEKCNEATS